MRLGSDSQPKLLRIWTKLVKEHNFATARCSAPLTCIPLAIRNGTPDSSIWAIGQFRKPYFSKTRIAHHSDVTLKLPSCFGKCDHLDHERFFIDDSCHRSECRQRLIEIRFQTLRVAITKGIVRSALAIKAGCNPKRRRCFTSPLYLPTVVQHMYTRIWW